MTRRRSWNAVCAMLMPTLLVTAACGDTDSPTGPSQKSLGWSFNGLQNLGPGFVYEGIVKLSW